jgi:FkbM family methyltransferase
VDFSRGAEQQLTGWDLFPVRLPGLPEPMTTVRQYVDLTGMSQGDVVLDLGAYAGVTAMEFQEVVGQNGRVVAVEADPSNIACARENISRYTRLRGYGPTLIEAAVWSQSGSVDFTAEGSLGSAVTVVLPRAAGSNATVRAVTLSEVMSLGSLTRVDIIKADIEGAEYMAFSDAAFFASQHPTLVFEPAGTTVALTQLGHIKELLGGYGYTCKVVDQEGSRLPLVVCR